MIGEISWQEKNSEVSKIEQIKIRREFILIDETVTTCLIRN